MPTRITFSDGRKIEFIYDATGRKWRKTAIPIAANVPPTYRDYIGEAEYLNGVQDIIHFTEGYAQRDITTDGDGVWNGWVYKYTLKDHLGNTRVTYSDKNKDGIVTTGDIEQVNNFYSFGFNMEGPWSGVDGAFKNQYNGKELNQDFGLDWNDYGARFYDAAIGRWNGVDLLAEGAFRWSPYRYGYNNPIRYFDWEGYFEIPKELIDKYPNLQNSLDKIAKRISSDSKISDAMIKYGQFRDKNQILNLFKADNKNIKLGVANLWQSKKAYADTGGDKAFQVEGQTIDGFAKRRLIRFDEALLSMMENLSMFSKDGQDFAERLFEATFIHELTHAGDDQDSKEADAQPLQFAPNNQGKWRPYKEIGQFIENQIYGKSIQYDQNGDTWKFINNYIHSLPPADENKKEKKDKPAPPRA